MGVKAVAVKTPLTAKLSLLTDYPRIEGRVTLPPRAILHPAAHPTMASAIAEADTQSVGAGTYVIAAEANAAFRAVNRLLAAGLSIARVPGGGGASAPRNDVSPLSPGSFVVTVRDCRARAHCSPRSSGPKASRRSASNACRALLFRR